MSAPNQRFCLIFVLGRPTAFLLLYISCPPPLDCKTSPGLLFSCERVSSPEPVFLLLWFNYMHRCFGGGIVPASAEEGSVREERNTSLERRRGAFDCRVPVERLCVCM